MFSFLKRKAIVEASPHMRRVIDLTTPNMLVPDEVRIDRRYNRALATCMCPWENGKPDHQSMVLGITKDVSDTGVCVLTTARLSDSCELAVSFLVETDGIGALSFFLATIERGHSVLGFFEYGLSITEYLNDSYSSETRALEGLIRNSYQQEFDHTKKSNEAEQHANSHH